MYTGPEKYWFKRKRYGMGWTPVTWEGWAVLGFFVLFLGIGMTQFPKAHVAVAVFCWAFGVIGLFAGTLLHGPKPKWRWGWKPDDDPDKDF